MTAATRPAAPADTRSGRGRIAGPLKLAIVAAAAAASAGCVVGLPPVRAGAAQNAVPYTLRLIGERTLDPALAFGGTTVGGLSGIDYDPVADLYYLISDDPAEAGPTRFYTARIAIGPSTVGAVALQQVVALKRPDGRPYAAGEADGESIRFDPRTGGLWWSSEGARGAANAAGDRAADPFVRRAALDGAWTNDVPLDPMFRFGDPRRGPRGNVVFEGLSLSPDGRTLWVAMEGPLRQDGPMPTPSAGAWARFSLHPALHALRGEPAAGRRAQSEAVTDAAPTTAPFGPLAAQYAYPVDPIPIAGAWTTRLAQTGVSEVLALDADRLLVVERALILGPHWRIRLFEADRRGATDVAAFESLVGRAFAPMTKRLVLDFDDLGVRIDNIEGLCFGPVLPNGHRTLVAVSDDNFNPGEVTQFLVFEIVPS